ncbi:MAG: DUF547 domain-containing protein [Rhodospirillales bacterium]|nr:DUF547 domain-containing protein [Rhodospirillales bacterium]
MPVPSVLRAAAAALLVLSALPVSAGSALAAPKADAWPRWEAHVAGSERVVNHDPWDAILAEVVRLGNDGVARVDYPALTGDALRSRLDGYIAQLASFPVSELDRAEQQAYWINLYNALTLQVMRDHYPVDSILDVDISPGLFSNGPWGAELIVVEDEVVTLDDIEHRILRPLWGDPRIHYAVNCASIGCPNLQGRAWRAATLDADLEAAATAFVNHDRGFTVDDGDLVVSSIYDWFIADFGGNEESVLRHLAQYASPDREAILQSARRISDHRYNWALNDLAGASP